MVRILFKFRLFIWFLLRQWMSVMMLEISDESFLLVIRTP